jgi:GNAT superfamily N-acetyltransferase
MDISTRPAVAADEAEVVRLYELSRAELSGERDGSLWAVIDARPTPSEASLREDIGSGRVRLGCIDGVPVGFAVAHGERQRDGSLLGVLDEIFAEPEARAVGVGEELIAWALEWARSNGCFGLDAAVLPGSRDAKNFFERAGLKARRIIVHRALS